MENILLIFVGILTGLIDSVVGGGGLISLPTLSIVLSPGVESVATNKILGAVGASISLSVYARKGHLVWKEAIHFCLVCALGSYMGSTLAFYVDKEFFRYFLIVMCPIILWMILKKDQLFNQENVKPKGLWTLLACALLSGFYDGFFGPGGGTFMFMSLYVFAGYPLLTAIAISKLANTFSATTALVNFSFSNVINWKVGLTMAIGIAIGAFVGANFALNKAAQLVRPLLIFVVTALLVSLIWWR